MKREFFGQIFEIKLEYKNFMKIRPVGVDLFHANGQTSMLKLIVPFLQFSDSPYKYKMSFNTAYCTSCTRPKVSTGSS